MNLKIGIGYDIHKLVEGRKLIIGGLEIPHTKGLLGHSDADVLLHAISDALLGAAGEKDIGELFPDTDKKYKDISSAILMKEVDGLIKKNGYEVSNIDTVVVAQSPKLNSFKDEIKKSIAEILQIDKERVIVKAKTQEMLGLIGNQEAISAYAVALLEKK